MLVKYEDLTNGNTSALKKIFSFLGVPTSQIMIEKINKKNKFSNFKDGKFFRNGDADEWKTKIDKQLLKEITPHATKELLDYFNYPQI